MKYLARNLKDQRGIGFLGIMFYLTVAGIVFLLGLKLLPAYLEYFAVKKMMSYLATSEEVRSGTVVDIRKSFERRAVFDNVEAIKAEDLEITKEGGETVVTATWTQRLPLFPGYTLLVDFSTSTAKNK